MVSVSPLYVLLGQACESSRTSTTTIKSGGVGLKEKQGSVTANTASFPE